MIPAKPGKHLHWVTLVDAALECVCAGHAEHTEDAPGAKKPGEQVVQGVVEFKSVSALPATHWTHAVLESSS